MYEKIFSLTDDKAKIKVGLEATGHYSLNLLGSLIDKGLHTCVINPLHTNLYRKGLSLRKIKTDKVDARSIAMMLMTNKTLKLYSDTSYHSEELKSLTRYRFDKIQFFPVSAFPSRKDNSSQHSYHFLQSGLAISGILPHGQN